MQRIHTYRHTHTHGHIHPITDYQTVNSQHTKHHSLVFVCVWVRRGGGTREPDLTVFFSSHWNPSNTHCLNQIQLNIDIYQAASSLRGISKMVTERACTRLWTDINVRREIKTQVCVCVCLCRFLCWVSVVFGWQETHMHAHTQFVRIYSPRWTSTLLDWPRKDRPKL